jgi:hypothetical protein
MDTNNHEFLFEGVSGGTVKIKSSTVIFVVYVLFAVSYQVRPPRVARLRAMWLLLLLEQSSVCGGASGTPSACDYWLNRYLGNRFSFRSATGMHSSPG